VEEDKKHKRRDLKKINFNKLRNILILSSPNYTIIVKPSTTNTTVEKFLTLTLKDYKSHTPHTITKLPRTCIG